MPTYTYVAEDDAGAVFTGTIDGQSKAAVREDLRKMQYHATHLAEEKPSSLNRWQGRVRRGDVCLFARELAVMYRTGFPLAKALSVIGEQTESAGLRKVVEGVQAQIEAGSSLHVALGRYPRVFSEFFLSMIEAGEAGGALDVLLERLADHLEKQAELKHKVVSAFAYPTVVVILGCLVTAFLVTVVVPVFATAYAKIRAGARLPAPTLALIAISNFARSYGWAVLAGLAAAGLAWPKLRRMPAVARVLDAIKMTAPLFGALNRKIAVSRFVRTLAVMWGNGVPLLHSLLIAERVAGSRLTAAAAEAIRASVSAGGPVSTPMRSHPVFPPMVVHMAATGEASGTVPEMLEKSADFLDRDIDRIIKRLIVLLEPLVTVGLAVGVGFILLALYLPMFDMLKLAK